MKGTVSQILNLGPSFDFMTKNGKLYAIFFQQYFLQCIKYKLGHI